MSNSARLRWVALVGAVTHERRAAHTAGYPLEEGKMLPLPDVVLVVPDDGGAMLFRYTAHGELAGDTWHATVGDAQEQAVYEYGDALVAWLEVPSEVTNAHEYAVRYAYQSLNKRGEW